MEDIGIMLWKQIEKLFKSELEKNAYIKAFNKAVEEGKATAEHVSLYASKLGEIASQVLVTVLTEENLPDGKLYWNIAKKTIEPLLRRCYDMVNSAASTVQKRLDSEKGIGLNPVNGEWPEERVRALIQRIVDESLRKYDG